MTASEDRVRAVVEPIVSELGYDLEALSVMAAGRRRMVKVVIDSDNGVDLDDVAAMSSQISRTLDDSDSMGEIAYVLEVTSPGVDRPLIHPRHWRRALSRLVKVDTASADGTDDESITGRVVSSDEDTVTLDVDGQERIMAYSAIAKAVVQVEFNRPSAPLTDFDTSDEFDDVEEQEQ